MSRHVLLLGDEVTILHLEHIAWLISRQPGERGTGKGSRRCLNTHCIITYHHKGSSPEGI